MLHVSKVKRGISGAEQPRQSRNSVHTAPAPRRERSPARAAPNQQRPAPRRERSPAPAAPNQQRPRVRIETTRNGMPCICQCILVIAILTFFPVLFTIFATIAGLGGAASTLGGSDDPLVNALSGLISFGVYSTILGPILTLTVICWIVSCCCGGYTTQTRIVEQ